MLGIRPFIEDDLEEVEKIYLDERYNRFFFLDQSSFSINDFKKDMKDKNIYVLIFKDQIIGFFSIYEKDNILTDLFISLEHGKSNIYAYVLYFAEDMYGDLTIRTYVKDILLLNLIKTMGYKNTGVLKDYFKEDYIYLCKENKLL